MPVFEDWESMNQAAQDICGDILMKYVAPVMEDIVKQHIRDDIYGVYTPIPNGWVNGETYQRRHVLEHSMYKELQGRNNDTVMVTSIASPSKSVVRGYSFHNRRPGMFLKLLEGPNMGIWRNGFPRPAISNAQKEIDNSKEIQSAIQNGIDKYFSG